MAERLKLENPGDELTLTITNVLSEEVGGYSYWKITDGAKEFVMPQKSLAAQMERTGGASAWEMVGKTIKFSRSQKLSQHGKPYWNVDVVSGGNGKPPVAKSNEEKPVSLSNRPESEIPPLLRNQEAEDKAELDAKLAGVDTSKLEKDLALYLSISEWVVKNVGPIYADGIGWSPESATAAVATIFTQAKRNQ